jgi:hypothetical protein
MVCVAEAGGTRLQSRLQRKGTIMRAHHVIIAAVAVILVGFGVKLIFFWAPTAEAKLSVESVSMDISDRSRAAGSALLPTARTRRCDCTSFISYNNGDFSWLARSFIGFTQSRQW